VRAAGGGGPAWCINFAASGFFFGFGREF